MAKLELIIGLGNPGSAYASTRHNAGAWWVDALCAEYKIKLKTNNKFKGMIAKEEIQDTLVYIFKPTSFMNLMGSAVIKIINYYNIPTESILIAHDDLDLEPGTIRIKNGGGHGGHNGLKDIITALNTKDFHRIRIGIGHPGDKDLVSDYVLHNPNKSDQKLMQQAIDKSMLELPNILHGKWQLVMNHLHDSTQ